MKKRFFFGLLFCFCLLLSLPCSASAEETETVGERMPDEYSGFLETIPEEIRELLPDSLFSADSPSVADGVREISGGGYLLRTVLSLLGADIGKFIRRFATVAGMLLLSAVAANASATFKSESVGRAFRFCSSLAVLCALLGEGYAAVSAVTSYFERIRAMTTAMIPLMGTLYAMGGNVTAAVASASGLSLYLTFLENFVAVSIVPFSAICLAFAAVGAMDSGVRLGTLLSTVKKNYTTALTFLMMILGTMLAAQTTLGARSDNLAMRSAKFAAGNLIPVVGGSVSELLRTVSAGVGYLRGTVGICAVILLLLTLFPTLVDLLLVRLCWQLSASFADLLGCSGEKKLLDELASVSGYLIAAVSICSSVLILALSLLIHCASALG